MARFVVLLSLLALVGTSSAQTNSVSDPQALALAAKSIAAITAGNPVSDISLAGNVTWFAGSDTETGTATLEAKGVNESRVDLILSGEQRQEIRNNSSGVPQGTETGIDGTTQPSAQHNCWTDPVWFFSGLSSLTETSNRNFIFSNLGQEQQNGVSVQHLRVYQLLGSKPKDIGIVQHLSAMDFYLDPTSFLPLIVRFNVHPDDDMNLDIRTEVRFGDYRSVNKILVPFRIQRLLNGSLLFDVTVATAQVNTGLSDTTFSIQ
jgi:hypothetical protein